MKADGSGMEEPILPHPLTISVWPHRIAVILVGATFPLLFIGGLVTGKGAGLAVPDWPTSFGYNMFLYPWSKMVGNIFYEHSHRLVASFVGLLTIALGAGVVVSRAAPLAAPARPCRVGIGDPARCSWRFACGAAGANFGDRACGNGAALFCADGLPGGFHFGRLDSWRR